MSQLTLFENNVEFSQISSVGDFPVKTSVVRVRKWAFQGVDRAYSLKSFDSLANYDQNTCFWKTSVLCLALTDDPTWTRYSGRWPRSGMMRNGIVYQPPKSMLSTNAIGFGSLPILLPTPTKSLENAPDETWDENIPWWKQSRASRNLAAIAKHPERMGLIPTPCAHDDNKSPESHIAMKKLPESQKYFAIPGSGLLPTPTASDASSGSVIGKNDEYRVTSTGSLRKHSQTGSNCSLSLGRLVQMPTPQARDWRQGSKPDSDRIKRKKEQGYSLNLNDKVLEFSNLPTPTSRDWKHGSSNQVNKPRAEQLNDRAAHETGGTRLNPYFVEAMMGFPVGWTDLSIQELPEPELLTHEDLHEALQYSTCDKLTNHKQRLMALGNAIVPQVAKLGFDRILELEIFSQK